MSNRVRLLLILLSVGLAGLAIVFLFMYMATDPVEELLAAGTKPSYADRGAFTNLTEIFQIPALMFFGVLVAYSVSELYKSYRVMNDPETYRNKTYQDTGIQTGRKERRAALLRVKSSPHSSSNQSAQS